MGNQSDCLSMTRQKSNVSGVVVCSSLPRNRADPSTTDIVARHDGVACTSCLSNPIVGRRFKALFIPDFNLCQICWAGLLVQSDASDFRFQEVEPDGLGPLSDEVASECIEAVDTIEPAMLRVSSCTSFSVEQCDKENNAQA